MMVSDEEKRWLVVGIAMNKVVAPVLRDFIKQGMDTHYANLGIYCSRLGTPCTLKTLTYHQVSTDPCFRHLKFQNVNNNLQLYGKHKNLYNYNINSSVDLAKLFVPDYLAEFSGFDESLDMSAILRLLGCNKPAPIFHSPIPLMSIQNSADDVRENVRNKWGHCNVTDWTEVLFNDCFSKLEALVRSLGLTGGIEKTSLDLLSDWLTKGCQLCMGHAVDQNLLSLVQQDVKELIKSYKKTEAEQSAIQESLAQQRTEQIEMQNTVTSVQSQQLSTRVQLQEHNELLEEMLKWKELQMNEKQEIMEKLVSLEKTLSDELLIRVEGLEKRLAEADDKVEHLERGFAKRDDKMEQVEQGFAKTNDQIEELEQGFAKTEKKFEQLEEGFAKTDERVEQLERGFAKTDDKVEQLEEGFAKTDDKAEQLERGFAKTDDRVEQLGRGFAKTDDKVKQLEEGFAKTDDRVEQLERGFAKADVKVGQLEHGVTEVERDLSKTDDKVEQLVEGSAKTDDKVEQLQREFAKVENDVFETGNKVKQLEEEVTSQRMRENKPEASPVETFDVKSCRSKLGQHYKRTATVPTSVWSKNSPVDIHQIYTRLSLVKKQKTLAGSSQSQLRHYTHVFCANKDGIVPKRILVQGQTGIGKSTFVKKLAVDWAELDDEETGDKQKDALKKFELVLVINLKEVSKCQSFRDVLSCCNIFPEEETALVEGLLSYITKNQDKVLLVFDGYDEYRCGRNSDIYEIFRGKKLRNCCVLITTRISKANDLLEFKDKHAEITGFSKKDREAFMCRMLGDKTEVNKLKGHLSREKLTDLTRVPLLLLFFCILWKNGRVKSFSETKAKLYLAIVQHVLDYSQGKNASGRFGKVQDFSEILCEIGKVALECLLKDDHVFEYDQLSAAILSDESLIIGLLQVTEYAENLRPAGMVSFIHKSVQEFLAAWYVTYRCVPEGNLGEIEQRARTLEDCKALENVLQFICSLSDEGAVKVFQHLASVRTSDPELKLLKALPTEEDETDIPLCNGTNRQRTFSNLVFELFREVDSKAELLSNCFDCLSGVVLVPSDTRSLSQLLPKMKDFTKQARSVAFVFPQAVSRVYKSLEFLDCLHVPLRISESSKLHNVGDFLESFMGCPGCGFRSILCFHNGQFRFYITDLELHCDHHTTLFTETNASDVSSVAVNLCSEQSCLKFLTSLHVHRVFRRCTQEGKVLGLLLRDCKHLKRIEVTKSDDSVSELLEHVANPSKCSLKICSSNVRTNSWLQRFNNIVTLDLDLRDCRPDVVDTLVSSITHKTLERLALSGISLTPVAAAALGRSLLEMSSLEILELTGKNEVLQAKEIESLFSGFSKSLSPLYKFSFRDFIMTSCLASLTKSFRFFPNLTELHVGRLNMDERNTCALLDSLKFIPSVEWLSLCNLPGDKYRRPENAVIRSTHMNRKEVELEGIILTPAVAAALGRSLPKMSSSETLVLTGVNGSTVQAEEMEALFGGFTKTLPLRELIFSGFSVRGCLSPLTKSFRFFPGLRELRLQELNMDEHDQCGLLESFGFIASDLTELRLQCKSVGQTDCCTTEVNTVGTCSYDCSTLKKLEVNGISLTPAAAAALGRLLPEMSSLETLVLTGMNGSTVQAEEMEALFGGFDKTLPLRELTFSGFSETGCLAPLTKSFRFFTNLRELHLEELNMDEHDQCGLLESFGFIASGLMELRLQCKSVGHTDYCTTEVNTVGTCSYDCSTLKKLEVNGISLTPAAALALGRSLPEMSSLQSLEFTGVNGSIVQAEEMEALFGGLNKTLPLYKLSFRDFIMTSCLASLTKSFRFFPNLTELHVGRLNMDERNACALLDSLKFIPNVECLSLCYPPGRKHSRPKNAVIRSTHMNRKEVELEGIILTPAVAAALGRTLPKMSFLETLVLTGVNGMNGRTVQAEEMEALFGGFTKTLPLRELIFSGFSVRGGLSPLTQSLHFFPNLTELFLEEFSMNANDLCGLLKSLRFIPNLRELILQVTPLCHTHCCSAEENTVSSFTHMNLEKLELNGISLTPAASAALGRLLPEMSSLETLVLTGMNGSIVQAEEMEALFGGFDKTLPLRELTFSGFSVTGCLAPLTKSFRFFTNLRELHLEELNMDEHDQCGLLESFGFIASGLMELRLQCKSVGQTDCRTTEVNTVGTCSYDCSTLKKLEFNGISLTPAAALALGRSLPEMSSLRSLEFTGVNGSTVQAEEMEALFGGLNKTLPLYKLSFRDFIMTSCLASLTKSFRFFPNLAELHVGRLNMDERNACALLDSLKFISNVECLSLCYPPDRKHRRPRNAVIMSTHMNRKEVELEGIILTPAVAAALGRSLPKMSSLGTLVLTGVNGSTVQTEEMEAVLGGFTKTLPLRKLIFSGFSVRGGLSPLTQSLHFFPNLTELFLDEFSMNANDLCGLLESLRFIPNLRKLILQVTPLCHTHCCSAEENTVSSFTHMNLKKLELHGISLTPAAAAALGRLLPEMSSLETLVLTGMNGSIVQAEEMEALFGGFDKTLPLRELTFSGVSVTGCLVPLTKSFRFFTNLRELHLEELNMDEHDQCGLLESFGFIASDLTELRLQCKSVGHTDCRTTEVNTVGTCRYDCSTLKKLEVNGINLTPAVAATLGRSLAEMSSLETLVLTGVNGSIVQAEEMEALFGGLNKTLSLRELTFSGFSVTGCLAPLTKSFRFFPNLGELYLGELNVDEHDQCGLLESFGFIASDLTELRLQCKSVDHTDCRTTEVNTIGACSYERWTLNELEVNGISLTPAVTKALGRLLPEMSSLETLVLTGTNGSIVQAEEMEALFGGFDKTLPLRELTFSGFSVTGCLAPLTKSFRFFTNLRELHLEELNMDEHDQCGLLESFGFIASDLTELRLQCKSVGHTDCRTTEVNTVGTCSYDCSTLKKLEFNGISLTPAAALALGRSLPEMSSLRSLEFTGVNGSTVQAEEMEALFGGLNKTLPLYKLSFRDFIMTSCLASLTKSFRFFPNLAELHVGRLNMDERNACALLDSLKFISNVECLSLCYPPDRKHRRPRNAVIMSTHMNRKEVELEGIILTPAVAAALGRSLPEMSSLGTLVLTGVNGSTVQTEEMEAVLGGFTKTLPLRKLIFSGFSVRGGLSPLTQSLHFFPNLTELFLEEFSMNANDLCGLLESLRFIPNLRKLILQVTPLCHTHCCSAEENTVSSFTHMNLKKLELHGISLTPAAAAALGRLLPEMSSLETLVLTGMNGSIVQAEEMEALFGGFDKTLPLRELTFSGVSVTGCLAPLTKSFRFFTNLRELHLEELNMDEHDQCGLLESFGFIASDLTELRLQCKSVGHTDCRTTEVNTVGTCGYDCSTLKKLEVNGISLTPAVAATLGRSLAEMSSLETLVLTGVNGSIVQAEEMEALFGGLNKTLSLRELTFSGFSVTGCLAPLTKSFRFFTNLRELHLEELNMDEHDQCGLLESSGFIASDLTELRLQCKSVGHTDCRTTEVNTVGTCSYECSTLKKLEFNGISLTPAAALALGRSLPEMSSLQSLEFNGVNGSILQAEEIEALFCGFNKALPLCLLTFRGFSVRGCLTPLTKSLRFFPNLKELILDEFSVGEHELCSLMDNLRLIPNLKSLLVQGTPLGSAGCCTLEGNTFSSFLHTNLEELILHRISLTPAAATALGRLLPEMSSLKTLVLSGVNGSTVQAEEMEALFGGFIKTLPLRMLTFSGVSVTGCLAPLTKSFRFFTNLRELHLEELNMDEHDQCGLLESFGFFAKDVRELRLQGTSLNHRNQADWCSREVNIVWTRRFMTRSKLELNRISLTPAVVAAIGRLLPEMSSLEILKVTGVNGSILQAEEMEALFGGLNKTLPLRELTFSGFSARGCLALLSKSIRFFPRLTMLDLDEFNVDDQDVRALLESLAFIRNRLKIRLSGNLLSGAVTFTIDPDQRIGTTVCFSPSQCLEEDLNYVKEAFNQVLPQVNFGYVL